jgi:superfamily II DNA or RNA helicase
MISGGVDIPRLRVGVYATTTTTELFFRQAVGRIVRYMQGSGRQRAYMFIPDDRRLRHFGHTIADSRRHSLTKNTRDREDDDDLREERADTDQLSLFAVHSATASELEADEGIFVDDEDEAEPELEPVEADELVIDLATVPLPGGAAPAGFGAGGDRSADRNERDRLRRINTDLTKELVEVTGRKHAAVNGELNRRAGISKISEATIIQLNRRSRAAEEWLRQEHRRKRFSAL